MRGSPHYSYADRAFIKLEARVIYRGLEPAIRDLKAQELSLKSL